MLFTSKFDLNKPFFILLSPNGAPHSYEESSCVHPIDVIAFILKA